MSINTLSLFNGMGCIWLAMEQAGLKVGKRYSSEIDKFATKGNDSMYSDTIQIGDVRNVDVSKLERIDFLAGGSPCQSFSFAGKRKGMSTTCEIQILTLEHYLELKAQNFEFEGQSYLFWEYIRILTDIRKYNPKVKFLLENVIMGSKWQKVLTRAIGINPIRINASLVSAQNRDRLFWTNIYTSQDGFFGDLKCMIPQPKDKGILLKDILETFETSNFETQEQFDAYMKKYFLSDKMLKNMKLSDNDNLDVLGHSGSGGQKGLIYNVNSQVGALCATDYKQAKQILVPFGNSQDQKISHVDGKSQTLNAGHFNQPKIVVHNLMPRSSKTGKGGTGHLSRTDGKTYCLDTGSTNAVEIKQKDNLVQIGNIYDNEHNSVAGRVYTEDGKSVTLSDLGGGGGAKTGLYQINKSIRRLTPRECGRLQTIPKEKLEILLAAGISDSQLYKMFGNGWCVDVIVHILSFYNK